MPDDLPTRHSGIGTALAVNKKLVSYQICWDTQLIGRHADTGRLLSICQVGGIERATHAHAPV
jgi:hypothetical protein